jgi:Ulp1 family protease
VLQRAHAQLRPGEKIGDDIINFYAAILHDFAASNDIKVYVAPHLLHDTVASKTGARPESYHKGLSADNFHDFERIVIAVHTRNPDHWSVIYVEPSARTIAQMDPIAGLAGKGPLTNVKGLVRVWNGGQEVGDTWKMRTERNILQQFNNNDCGPLSLLFMRMALMEQARPMKMSVDGAKEVGRRFRRRLMAELVANKLNPKDSDISNALRSESLASHMLG